MWNTLDVVAKNNRLDKKKFIEFALKNREKYHLDDHDMVGTWYVDDLIGDFKKHHHKANIANELVKLAKDIIAEDFPVYKNVNDLYDRTR